MLHCVQMDDVPLRFSTIWGHQEQFQGSIRMVPFDLVITIITRCHMYVIDEPYIRTAVAGGFHRIPGPNRRFNAYSRRLTWDLDRDHGRIVDMRLFPLGFSSSRMYTGFSAYHSGKQRYLAFLASAEEKARHRRTLGIWELSL